MAAAPAFLAALEWTLDMYLLGTCPDYFTGFVPQTSARALLDLCTREMAAEIAALRANATRGDVVNKTVAGAGSVYKAHVSGKSQPSKKKSAWPSTEAVAAAAASLNAVGARIPGSTKLPSASASALRCRPPPVPAVYNLLVQPLCRAGLVAAPLRRFMTDGDSPVRWLFAHGCRCAQCGVLRAEELPLDRRISRLGRATRLNDADAAEFKEVTILVTTGPQRLSRSLSTQLPPLILTRGTLGYYFPAFLTTLLMATRGFIHFYAIIRRVQLPFHNTHTQKHTYEKLTQAQALLSEVRARVLAHEAAAHGGVHVFGNELPTVDELAAIARLASARPAAPAAPLEAGGGDGSANERAIFAVSNDAAMEFGRPATYVMDPSAVAGARFCRASSAAVDQRPRLSGAENKKNTRAPWSEPTNAFAGSPLTHRSRRQKRL